MDKQLRELIQDYKKQFNNYIEYINDTDWVNQPPLLRKEAYDLESSIINNVIKNIENFQTEVEGNLHLKTVQKVITLAEDIVKSHIDRIDTYLEANDWTEMFTEDMDYLQKTLDEVREEGNTKEEQEVLKHIRDIQQRKKDEIYFQDKIFTQKTKSLTNLSKKNISSESSNRMSFELRGNQKVPLLMRGKMSGLYPQIESYSDSLNIVYPSPSPSESKELLINMNPKDIPPYDPDKHFWEQEKSTIQFWEEEIQKIKYGVNINGYLFDPWLYWHANIYTIPSGNRMDKGSLHPKIRDNEYFFIEMFRKCEIKRDRGLIMYGTRRFAKSTILASKTLHSAYTIENAKCTVQGFVDNPDLKAISSGLEHAVTHMTPALKINNNLKDFSTFVQLGLKLKNNDVISQSEISIINLREGAKSGSQKTAGATPDSFIFDEIGKGKCKKAWLAAIPSFQSPDGWLTTPLLSGTSGEADLSKDAEDLLKDPRAYQLEVMDWDMLEEHVDPEYITWKRDTFGFFVPGQLNRDTKKIQTTFGEYVGQPGNKELCKIVLEETDWKTATEKLLAKRKALAHDRTALNDERRFAPINIDDMFLAEEDNRFPTEEARLHREKITKEGKIGVPVILNHDENSNTFEINNTSKKTIQEYPWRGGNHDAPIMMLERLTERPQFGHYVIGFDDVKHDTSDGDSVLSAHVYKRGFQLDEWSDRIVAYYASRPERKSMYYEQLYYLMLYYNAIVFYENADNGFKDYVERRSIWQVEKHFAKSIDWGKSMESQGLNYNKNRPYGWYPSPKNILHLNNRVLEYSLDDESGENTLGVTRINDPMLLVEMENYKKGQNADRLRSFGLAYIYAEYLDKSRLFIKKNRFKQEEEEKKEVRRIPMQSIPKRNIKMKRL